jgi:hypothetical protein
MWHSNPNATLNQIFCVVVSKIPYSLGVWSLFGHDFELETHKQVESNKACSAQPSPKRGMS